MDTFTLDFGIYGHKCISAENSLVFAGGISTLACDEDYIYRFETDEKCMKIERIEFEEEIVIMHGHHLEGNQKELKLRVQNFDFKFVLSLSNIF